MNLSLKKCSFPRHNFESNFFLSKAENLSQIVLLFSFMYYIFLTDIISGAYKTHIFLTLKISTQIIAGFLKKLFWLLTNGPDHLLPIKIIFFRVNVFYLDFTKKITGPILIFWYLWTSYHIYYIVHHPPPMFFTKYYYVFIYLYT